MKGDICCEETRRSREEVLDRAARIASVFGNFSAAPGSTIALLARNRIETLETHLAARLLDANVVPLNWHGTGEDARYILADAAPTILVGDADLLAATKTKLPKLDFCMLEDAISGTAPCVASPLGLGGALIYTSGTSGRPKGVKRLPSSPEQAAHRREVLRLVYDGAAENSALVTGPLYHLFSLATAMTNFAAGGRVTIMPRFDPEDMLRLIERDRITHTSAVPTMLVRLLRLPNAVRMRYDLSSLRHVTLSGAPCPADVKRALIEWLGPVIYETYGSTETGVMTQISSEDWLARPGSVGRPVSTGEIRVLDDKGHTLPPGAIGDIYVWMHGAPDFTYLGDAAKRATMERDGLVTVGDMGWLDEEGWLYVCDRRDDMVIVGGANIYPAEIEAALLAHPGVMDAAAFGVPDPDYGERLIAHVAVVEGAIADESALMTHLEGRLAKTKWPRRIFFDAALPRSENGKILKRVLRERYCQEPTK